MDMVRNLVPPGHKPTELQQSAIDKLNAENIKWIFQDTAGGCNALVVKDAYNEGQVVITNCDDDGDDVIFVIDSRFNARLDGSECALFGIFHEKWGNVVYKTNDVNDFMNFARFFTMRDSDPFEHVLSNGQRVHDVFLAADDYYNGV
jgi:hypothetical protein